MNKILILFLLGISSLYAACPTGEILQSNVSLPYAQPNGGTIPLGSFAGQTVDQTNACNTYIMRVCLDPASWPDFPCSTGQSTTVTANCPINTAQGSGTCNTTQNHYSWSPSSGNVGTINPADGLAHIVHFVAISQLSPGSGDIESSASPIGFTWDTGASNFLRYETPILTSSIPFTASQIAVIANSSDTYSIGSAGTTICTTVEGQTLKDDGVAGYFIQKHSIPCGNAHSITTPVTDTITFANYKTALDTILTGLGAGIQAITLAWNRPNIVAGGSASTFANCVSTGTLHQPCYGISGLTMMYRTLGGIEPTGAKCIQQTYGLGWGPENPWFNSGTNSTPRTSFNVLPTIMLVGATCPTCTSNNIGQPFVESFTVAKAVIDTALTTPTNPSGTGQIAYTTNINKSPIFLGEPPASFANGFLDPHFNVANIGTFASPATPDVTQGIKANSLLYYQGSSAWTYDGAGVNQLNAVAGAGLATSYTSVSANILDVGGAQTTYASWFGSGNGTMSGTPMVASIGTAVEPCTAGYYKELNADLFIKYYGAGWDVLQAAWKAYRYPWNANMAGDPFAQPFSSIGAIGGSFLKGNKILGGKLQ